MASMMQLEFTQAMSDFQTMFPDMDGEVIEAVLRANQGAVDATIDQLLAMSTDNQNERLRQEIEHVESRPSPRDAPANASEAANIQDTNRHAARPLSEVHGWAPLLLGALPDGFLRLESPCEDEQIALLLQNEELVAQLRRNREFMSALDSEAGGRTGDDDAAFRERLRNMGKLSRKKFAQLSKMFNRQGKRGGTPARPPRHGPAPDSRLLQEEHSDDEDRPAAPAHK